MPTPFSLLAPELSNPDPNNDVVLSIISYGPGVTKHQWFLCLVVLCFQFLPRSSMSHAHFSFSAWTLIPQLDPPPQYALVCERAPLQVLSPWLLLSQTPRVIGGLLAEAGSPPPLVIAEAVTFNGTNSGTPLARMRQLLRQSQLAQIRTAWLFGTKKEGENYFAGHSEDLGGTLRTWGKNSLLLFPEGSHPSAIHRPSYTRKKKNLAQGIGNHSLRSCIHICLPAFCPQTFQCGIKILRSWKMSLFSFFFFHYTCISPPHITDYLNSLCKIHRDQWVKYQLRNAQPESRGLKWRQFVSSLFTSSH